MLHHLRTIVRLFTRDELGLTVVHYYDSAIQLARFSTKEPTEDEFRMGMDAAQAIKKLYVTSRLFAYLNLTSQHRLYECQLEMTEDSLSDLRRQTSTEL